MLRRKFFWLFLLMLFVFGAGQTNRNISIKEAKDKNPKLVQEILRKSKAADIHALMKESIDPCQNFYGFSCGKWMKINPANPVGRLTTGLFELMSKALERKFGKILNSASDSGNATATDTKVKDFYKSCMNVSSLKAKYKKTLMDVISEFGEMPALKGDNWNETSFDWVQTVANVSRVYGKHIILAIEVSSDFVNNSINRVYMGQPDFPLEARSMYLDERTQQYRNSYTSKIQRELVSYLGLTKAKATQTAIEIVGFEVALANGMIDENLGLGLEEIAKLVTVPELQAMYGTVIDFDGLLFNVFNENITDQIYVYGDDYIPNVVKVVQETPKRIVANYIYYSLITDFFLEIKESRDKQETNCLGKTKSNFAEVLDNMIYREYFTKDTEHDVNLIWQELKANFAALLRSNKLDWIEMSTRKYALEKLDVMKMVVNSYSDKNFTADFEMLNISNDDYVDNVRNVMKVNRRKHLDELHKPPKPIEAAELLSYTPANVIVENTIKVPVSILQPNYLWDSSYPLALKFGTLGTLVGHELIHSFDDNGRKYDKQGNNRDWWDRTSSRTFIERTKCFSDQYGSYVYGGQLLPHSVHQSENIADNGGLRLAYAAYVKWLDEAAQSGRDMHLETLPSLNYTSKQLFFISYAQIWCNDVTPGMRVLQMSIDEHVPGKYRVNGPVSNFNEFANEFNCPLGSPMNPIKKCEIY